MITMASNPENKQKENPAEWAGESKYRRKEMDGWSRYILDFFVMKSREVGGERKERGGVCGGWSRAGRENEGTGWKRETCGSSKFLNS